MAHFVCAKYSNRNIGRAKKFASRKSGIFHPSILGIKYPSQVYLESHMSNVISLKLSEDPVVRKAVACQLERERACVKKSSTAVECEEIFEKLNETNPVPTPGNCSIATKKLETQRLKNLENPL